MSDSLWSMDCSLPSSSVPEDSPGKNTGVGCVPSSRGSSQPRDGTHVSHNAGGFLTIWATRKGQENWSGYPLLSPIELGTPALQKDSLPAELPGKPTCITCSQRREGDQSETAGVAGSSMNQVNSPVLESSSSSQGISLKVWVVSADDDVASDS